MTQKELLENFRNLADKRKAEVLFAALGYMQQYNGRSQSWCIAKATSELLKVKMKS